MRQYLNCAVDCDNNCNILFVAKLRFWALDDYHVLRDRYLKPKTHSFKYYPQIRVPDKRFNENEPNMKMIMATKILEAFSAKYFPTQLSFMLTMF